MFHFAAVAIEDAVFEINAFNIRLFDQQQLVRAHAEMPVRERAHLGSVQRERFGVAVEHDKVVARAVHFGEFEFHGAIVSDTQRRHALDQMGGEPDFVQQSPVVSRILNKSSVRPVAAS